MATVIGSAALILRATAIWAPDRHAACLRWLTSAAKSQMFGDQGHDAPMNRVAVRSRRIVTNWILPFLAQDGRAYRFAGEERGEVSGRCDDLHAYTGQQSRRAAIRCAEDLGQVPVGTGAEPYEKDIIDGSVASLAKGRCVIGGLPVHLMILRWPDGPVAMPSPRSERTVRERRRARRSGPRRQCRPGGRTSRPGPCAARASPRSP